MLTLQNEEPRTQEELEETLFEESQGLDVLAIPEDSRGEVIPIFRN